ncbi:MAG: hypothetical protein B7Z55_13625 [Planctomycetales bacterium 12-60-4]|nr:MAG: hypothetical protein B7Z55_13625 [Planctomycetales bacterium 12-60-4]
MIISAHHERDFARFDYIVCRRKKEFARFAQLPPVRRASTVDFPIPQITTIIVAGANIHRHRS